MGLVIVGDAPMGVLQLDRHAFDAAWPGRLEGDQPRQVVADKRIHRGIVEEVAEVEQHAAVDPVRHVRRVAGDQRPRPPTRAPPQPGRTCGAGVSVMFGPQWTMTTTSSSSVARAASGSTAAQAHDAGRRTRCRDCPIRRRTRRDDQPRTAHAAGARPHVRWAAARRRCRCRHRSWRCRRPRDAPACRSERRRRSPAHGLLAGLMHVTPSSASRSAAAGGARKKKGLPGSSIGVPRSETQHSRLRMKRSAGRAMPASAGSSRGRSGSLASWAATPGPSVVSPASARVSTMRSQQAPTNEGPGSQCPARSGFLCAFLADSYAWPRTPARLSIGGCVLAHVS